MMDFKREHCKLDNTLRGTGLLIFPYDWMKNNYLLAGSEVILKISSKKSELILMVGAFLKDNGSTVLVDEECRDFFSDDTEDRIEVARVNELLPDAENVTLILETGVKIDDIMDWLKKRKGINRHVVYAAGSGKVVFLDTIPDNKGYDKPVNVSATSIRRIYYLENIQSWKDKWKEYNDKLSKKNKAENECKKASARLQESKNDVSQLVKEIPPLIEDGKNLLSQIEEYQLINNVLDEDFTKELEEQKNKYSNFCNSEPKSIEDLKTKLDACFNYKIQEDMYEEKFRLNEEILCDNDDTANLDGKIKNSEKSLNAMKGFMDQQDLSQDRFVLNKKPQENLEKELSDLDEIIKRLAERKEGFDEKQKTVTDKIHTLRSAIEDLKTDDKCKDNEKKLEKDVTGKMKNLEAISANYPPCRNNVSEIKDMYTTLLNHTKGEKLYKGFKSLWGKIRFLKDAADKAKKYLEEVDEEMQKKYESDNLSDTM